MARQENTAQSTALDVTRMPSTAQLREIGSLEDALKLAEDVGAEVTLAEELGDGFTLIEDKNSLVGKKMVLISWTFSEGDFGNEFASIRAVVAHDNGSSDKIVFNDGSTGVCAQLRELTDRGKTSFLYAPKGLRRSDYEAIVDGKRTRATTYYVDTAAR